MTARRAGFSRARTGVVAALVVALTASLTLTSASVAGAAPPTDAGTFVSLEPARVLDTRSGNGAPQKQVAAYGTVALQVTGRGGVPQTGVSAVVVNVTVTGPRAGGFVTVYPSGTPMPTASNLNFTAGLSVPNLVTVKVGADGRVNLTNNSSGSTDLIADVSGYYLAGTATVPGAFVSLDPSRILDTREGVGAAQAPVAPSGTVGLQATGRGGVPADGVAAVVVNVTATAPTAGGFVTVYPSGTGVPAASNLNFGPRQNVPNLVTVKVGTDGKINLVNFSAGTVDLIADVAGYYLAGTATVPGAFVSLAPSRVLDTRDGTGTAQLAAEASEDLSVQVAARGGVPSKGAAAVVMNVTVTQPSSGGFITVYPTAYLEPTASNLNFSAGQNIPNLATVKVGGNGRVSLINYSPGTVHLIADLAGYFIADPDELVLVFPMWWSYQDCDYDSKVIFVASPGLTLSPTGNASTFQGESTRDIYAGSNLQVVVTVSAQPGFELLNPDPSRWYDNGTGTLSRGFSFGWISCWSVQDQPTARGEIAPRSIAPLPESRAATHPAQGSPLVDTEK
jgi:hypothetical protein